MINSMKESRLKKYSLNAVWIIIALLIWEIGARKYNNSIILPSFIETGTIIIKIIKNGELLKEIGETVLRGIIGMGTAFILGIILGTIMGINNWINNRVMPLVTFLQAAPVISWLLLFLIWADNKSVPIFVIVISVAPMFIINIVEGIKKTDKKLIEMAELYKITKIKIIKEIYIPSVTGYIVSSLKNGLGVTFRVAVMAEVLAHPGNGIGERMNSARINVETGEIFAWTIIIIAITFIFEKIILKSYGKLTMH